MKRVGWQVGCVRAGDFVVECSSSCRGCDGAERGLCLNGMLWWGGATIGGEMVG
jgi:hypothetical protein